MISEARQKLQSALDRLSASFESVNFFYDIYPEEIGRVLSYGGGVALADGLPGVAAEEMVLFSDGSAGMVMDMVPEGAGIILLSHSERIHAGSIVKRTGKVIEIAVGEYLLGRVINALGEPLDNLGRIIFSRKRPVEMPAPDIMDRAPVSEPLLTGIKAVDALFPIGKGQRELILGDRQTGKSSIALDAIINQKNSGVVCVYCAIGQKSSSVAGAIERLKENGALDYTVVVFASGDDTPGMQYIAPYAATSIAEYFMENGKDVLIVYDDLTRHARAYRELSLLLRRPPGREAFPGDIFYIHSRLLERSTHLKQEAGGGSLTALPIVETEEGNLSGYIPTNIISITDGQLYLSPELFQKGLLPAIDIGRSVSRVGGKAQYAAYRAVVSDLRFFYSQFQELEIFSRFGTRLDDNTRKTLNRGRKIREILKQPETKLLSAEEQITGLICVTRGLLDDLPDGVVNSVVNKIVPVIVSKFPWLSKKINDNKLLDKEDITAITLYAGEILSLDENRAAQTED